MLEGSSLPQMGYRVGEVWGGGWGTENSPNNPPHTPPPSRPQHVPSASAAASPVILVAVAVVAAELAVRSAQFGRGAGLRAGGNGRGLPDGPGAELRGPRPRGARFRAPPDGSARCALSRCARRIVPSAGGTGRMGEGLKLPFPPPCSPICSIALPDCFTDRKVHSCSCCWPPAHAPSSPPRISPR